MGEYININGEKYIYEKDYKDNDVLRKSFNSLARKNFGIDFEGWYRAGYWGEKYITYSLICNNNVIANVSVNTMDFLVHGERKKYIQIGTVMTDKEYRNRGLGRFLMNKVIEEWEDRCEFIYLFANDSAVNFYPKFNFIKVDEYESTIDHIKSQNSGMTSKINMDNSEDKEKFLNIIQNSKNFAKITMTDNVSLIMFYCESFMKDNIYYIEEYDAIVIAEYIESNLYINDIFSTEEIEINKVVSRMCTKNINRIIFGFTPIDDNICEQSILKEDDTTLFIRKKNNNNINLDYSRFPVLSRA